MPYQLFQDLFPDVAERETRMVTVLESSDCGLPAGRYLFLEMFCNEPGCDCRRVFFYVVSSSREDLEAVIAWGWETPGFYAKWMGDDDPQTIAELKGPVLNLGSPQTALGPAILNLCRDVLLRDKAYVDRVKRHYRAFRDKIDAAPKRKRKPNAATPRKKRKRKR